MFTSTVSISLKSASSPVGFRENLKSACSGLGFTSRRLGRAALTTSAGVVFIN